MRTKTNAQSLKSHFFLYDNNGRAHRAWITNEFLAENHVEPYLNLGYSPDLGLCDFFLFAQLKNQLGGIELKRRQCYVNCFRTTNLELHKRRL